MKKLVQFTMAAALVWPLAAQTQGPNDGISRQQADQILNELRQIRQLLEKQAAGLQGAPGAPKGPQHASLDLSGFQMLGDKNAPLTMVEYTDYQCPFCQRFHTTVFDEIKKNYIDSGKVRFYSKDLPIDSIHANAFRAAEAGHCAAEQGQFWKMRDVMAANPSKLDLDSLVADATELKMDPKAFRTCVESDRYRKTVEADVVQAEQIGADGTPTFVIGKSTPNGVEGDVLVGAMPFSAFDAKLKQLGAK